MKKLLVLPLLLCLSLFAQAQFGLGVAYQFGVPQSNYSGEMKNSVAGGLIKLQYHYDDYVKLNLSTGYFLVPFDKLNIEGVQTKADNVNLTIIPVTLGAEFYFLTEKVRPFVGVDAGWAYTMQSKSDNPSVAAINRNNVIVAPSIGVAYKLSENLDVYGSVRENIIFYQYQDVTNNNETFLLLGVNVGLNFRF